MRRQYFIVLLLFFADDDGVRGKSKDDSEENSSSSTKNSENIVIADAKPSYSGYPQVPPPSSLFQTQPTKFRQDFSTLPIVVNADRVSKIMRKLANEDMGVYSMQTILDGMGFRSDQFEHGEEVRKMAESVDSRMEDVRKIVYEIRRAVLTLFAKSPIDMQIFRQYRECCTLDKKLLGYSSRYAARINSSLTCDVLPQRRLSAFSFYPGKNLSSVFMKNAEREAAIRWQYFITADGIHTEYPAHQYDDRQNFSRCLLKARFRRWHAFVTAALPFQKTIVLIIDRGSGVSPAQLETAKCVAKSVINSLNDLDRISVFAIGGSVMYPSLCQRQQQYGRFPLAIQSTKNRLAYFLDSLTRDGERTNHTQAFSTAFDLYVRLFSSLSTDAPVHPVYPTIIYVSRGLLSEITEAKQVLATIVDGIQRTTRAVRLDGGGTNPPGLVNPVQINTVALMEPGKLVMWETQFLHDVATQNFSKHKLAGSSTGNDGETTQEDESLVRATIGRMLTVNATSNADLACVALPDIVSLLDHVSFAKTTISNENEEKDAVFSKVQMTFSYEASETAFVSASLGVYYDDRFIGVAGVDLALADLLSPAIFYTSADTSAYVAVTDVNGFVLHHPKLPLEDSRSLASATTTAPLPWFEDLPKEHKHLQKAIDLERAISNQWYGFYDFEFDEGDNVSNSDRNYFWHKTADRFFTFVISASEGPANQVRKNSRHDSKIYVQHALSYHRLDYRLNKDVRLCHHGKSLATFERAGVFLSPRAFDRPYERRTSSETKQSAQGYWAYTTDDTRLITNPGLKHGVRTEVGAFSKIAHEWKKQAEKSVYRLSIIRRYLATPSGILLTYPASTVDQAYDPLTTDWYRNALQNPGRVVLSHSRLDPYGFGNLITISHTVYEGKAAMHQPTDSVVAVMAVDVPLTFVYKLLYDSLSICRESNVDCFLFNEYGYVVANRNALTSDDQLAQQTQTMQTGQPQYYQQQQVPTEVMHIAHREPSVASEILQRKGFVTKMSCARLGDQTMQRFYMFNTSFTDVLRSSDGCLRYQVAIVPQTNVFLAVVNRSCHRHSSFCPCSVNDRRCLNCHRGFTEPSESWCECPCECPLNSLDEEHWCRRQGNAARSESLNSCRSSALPDRVAQLDAQFLTSNLANGLSACLPIQCGEFDTENVCRGVMGCEWCSFDSDGRTSLKAPYCSSLNSCFGGVQGLAAYSDEDASYDPIAVPTPVGPVAGGIMGIFVLLVAGVYWYRHHVVRMVEGRHGRYGSSGSASCLQRFDESTEEGYHFDDGSGSASSGTNDDKGPLNGGNALLLASFERENMGIGQAPRPRYRPGPRTESSDPGYSTMTGNCDDSEQATTIEPFVNGVRPAKIPIRLPPILLRMPRRASTSAPFGKPTIVDDTRQITLVDGPPNATTTMEDPSEEVPGATVLPLEVPSTLADVSECTVIDPAQTSLLSSSDNSSTMVQGTTNIVTMALIHYQPSVVETS